MDRKILRVLACIALSMATLRVVAQTPSVVDELAERAAQQVVKSRARSILIAPLTGCVLDEQRCVEFDAALRSALQTAIPGMRFVAREDAVGLLTARGMLALDAYFDIALETVASSAGAEILVTADLEWNKDGYELSARITDTARRKRLSELKSRRRLFSPRISDGPVLYTDPDSEVSFLVRRNPNHQPSVATHPQCVSCPEPKYTSEALVKRLEGKVVLMATITEQGVVRDIAVLQNPNLILASLAIETPKGWRLRPGIRPDGKPFAARMPIEINFRLQ